MKKQNEMKSITFENVTDIARSTMTDIDRIMRLFSEDTVMRYGSVCQNTAVVYELFLWLYQSHRFYSRKSF